MPTFLAELLNPGLGAPANVMREVIRGGLAPLAERAGKTFSLRFPGHVTPDVGRRLAQPEEAPNRPADIEIELTWDPYRLPAPPDGAPRGTRSGCHLMTFDQYRLASDTGVIWIDRVLELRAQGGELRPPRNMFERRTADFAAQTAPLFHQGEPAFARAVGNLVVHEVAHPEQHARLVANIAAGRFGADMHVETRAE